MRMVVIAVISVFFVPNLIIDFYQNTFTTGVDAISYSEEESFCQFDLSDEETLDAFCELPLINNSNKEIMFEVEFYEEYDFKDELSMESLMNVDAP